LPPGQFPLPSAHCTRVILDPDKSPSGHFSVREICTGDQFSVHSFVGPDSSPLMSLHTRTNLRSYAISLSPFVKQADYNSLMTSACFIILLLTLKYINFRKDVNFVCNFFISILTLRYKNVRKDVHFVWVFISRTFFKNNVLVYAREDRS